MNILVTGASGFIGSYIVEEGLRQGHQVWAGVRKSSSKAYLQDERIRFACLDLSSKARLAEQLCALKAEMGGCGWDVVVHAAGATKCLHAQDFYRTNYDGTVHLVEALREAGMMPARLVYLSSLSVFGAIREQPVRKPTQDNPWVYAPILGTDSPEPNTEYGRSKWKAEQWLAEQKDVPYTILRPTGVYGPREKDYFLMAQSIKQHTDFTVGFKPQEITFVYVMDVVQAVFKCIGSPQAVGRAYFQPPLQRPPAAVDGQPLGAAHQGSTVVPAHRVCLERYSEQGHRPHECPQHGQVSYPEPAQLAV